MSTLYEQRVKRLHDHVMKQQKEAEQTQKEPELTNAELKAKLDELGVEYEKRANKATLLALLEQAQSQDGEPDPEDDLEDDDEGAE